jgi:exocyst complex component 3
MSAVPPISAAQAVAELLILPEDLTKITAIRAKLEKEKASIDVKLRSGVKDQLESTREALSKLQKSKDGVRGIQDDLMQVDKLCRDPQIAVKNFDRTSRVRLTAYPVATELIVSLDIIGAS